MKNISLGLCVLLCLVSCKSLNNKATHYGQNSEKVYLSAENMPNLIIPSNLQNTTRIQALYPIPEGPRRTQQDGSVDLIPPQTLSLQKVE